jgi:hypothetical protein
MHTLAAAKGWTIIEWLHTYLYQLQAASGTRLPQALGGKASALIAASMDALINARREGADLSQAIVLGPAEAPYRALVESIVQDAGDDLAAGAILNDPSALTPYELFVYEAAVVKRQSGRALKTAHPVLVRVDGVGARTVAWQSVAHLAAEGAGTAPAPHFGSGPQSEADVEVGAEIGRVAERVQADLRDWVDKVTAQLDRLQDEVVEPFQGLPVGERRARYSAVARAIAERKRQVVESAEISVQPPRLVGRVYVRAAAPVLGQSSNLKDRELSTTDSEMISMRFCQKLLEEEGFDVDDVHQSGCGYDLHAQRNYEQRCIEVKGLQEGIAPGITLESSEWLMAQQYRDDYWVYVVVDCSTEPKLFGVYRNPVSLFGDEKQLIQRFHIAASTLRRALAL